MNEKYYVFTGAVDLSGCHLRNVRTEDGALIFSEGGAMLSPCLDSGESGTIWDRAEISFPPERGGYFRITVLSSDSLAVNIGGRSALFEQALEEIFTGGDISELTADAAAVSYISPDTAPLHALRGRYLWFIVEAFPEKGGRIRLNSVKICYPFRSLMDALPEIVRRTDSGRLASMLAAYRTVFDRLDRRIADFDSELDIDSAGGEALQRLVSWQGIPISRIWGDEILRNVTRESAQLIRRKGTKAALLRLFELLLGEAPIIEENSGGAFSFTVRVRYGLVPDGAHHRELLYLLKEFTPAGIVPRLLLERDGGGASLGGGTTLSDEAFDSGIILE